MVLTCPSCSAHYRLQEGRMHGRGARVVCPRCSHVFVVIKDDVLPGEAPAPQAPPPEPPLVRPTPRGPIRVVAPLPRKARRDFATGEVPALAPPETRLAAQSRGRLPAIQATTGDEAKVPAGQVPPPVPARGPGPAPIRSWKVRARIGITYEFADLPTMRRYLAQGRIGCDDELSLDGRAWRRLGELGDLDRWFAGVCAAAEAAGGRPDGASAAPPPSRRMAAVPAPDGSRPGSSSSLTAVRPGPSRSGSRQQAGPPGRRTASTGPNRSERAAAVAASLILLLAAGLLLFGRSALVPPGPGAAVPEPVATSQAPSTRSAVAPEGSAIPAEPPAAMADRDDAPAGSIPRPSAGRTGSPGIVASDRSASSGGPASGVYSTYTSIAGEAPRRSDRGAQQIPGDPGSRLPPPSQIDRGSRGPAGDPRAASLAAENWYRGGSVAMSSQDYGKARDMFARAVARAPQDARYWEALGDAQRLLGDTAEAARSYSRAETLGEAKAGR